MSTKYYVDQLREQLAEEFPGTQFFFQPADMVSQILNFGVPAPDRYSAHRPEPSRPTIDWRSRSPTAFSTFPARWTCTCSSCSPTPTIFLNVDRTRAQSVGLSQQDVANSLLLTLSSSFQINPSFWVNPANGIEYNVAVQVPQYKIDSMQALDNIPISSASTKTPQILGNLAHDEREYRTGADHPLQQPADDRRLCFRRRARSGRRGQRHSESAEGFSETSFRAARNSSAAAKWPP